MLHAITQCLLRNIWRFCTMRNLFLLNIVILLLNIVFYIVNNHLIISRFWFPIESFFLSPLDPEYEDLLDQTFRTFVQAMDSNNMTFFLFSGSLIGSVRHHGRIPWDDDIDVIINITDRDRVFRALTDINPRSFGLFKTTDAGENYVYQWKFYPRAGMKLFYKDYRTPNVDVFFFVENDTHIWNSSPYFSNTEIWPKSHVFPLRRRPFDDHVILAPCNVDAFLKRHFDISVCQSRIYSHLFDVGMPFKPVSVPCQRLARLYPFVEKSPVLTGRSGNRHIVESLMYRGTVLKKFTTRVPC